LDKHLGKYPDLFVLRHGQTQWNLAGRFQGQQDSPLTEKGQAQAILQNKLLQRVDPLPRLAFVSPQGRTMHTAQLALPREAEQHTDDRLKEIRFGAWEGLTKQEVKDRVGQDFETGLWHFESPQGETYEEISQRVRQFLEEQSEPAIIVTHGITSILLRGFYLGLGKRELLQLPRKQGCIYHLSGGTEKLLADEDGSLEIALQSA